MTSILDTTTRTSSLSLCLVAGQPDRSANILKREPLSRTTQTQSTTTIRYCIWQTWAGVNAAKAFMCIPCHRANLPRGSLLGYQTCPSCSRLFYQCALTIPPPFPSQTSLLASYAPTLFHHSIKSPQFKLFPHSELPV